VTPEEKRDKIIAFYTDNPDMVKVQQEAWMVHLTTGCDVKTAALKVWAKFHEEEGHESRPAD